MIYVKSVGAGIVGALLSAVVVGVGIFAWFRFEIWRQMRASGGGIGAVSVGIAEGVMVLWLVLAFLGFAVGFWWKFRRASY
jgi:hypothetical protein